MAIKVLVVDDSALMRKHLTGLFKDAGFEVALARNGNEAVDQVSIFMPDVVTLDINMPQMDGLTALALIMATRPTPTVMVSSLTTKGALATLEALAMGAVDFVAKPGGTISLSMDLVAQELVNKVRTAAKAKMRALRARPDPSPPLLPPTRSPAKLASPGLGLVMIGVSTGGPRTLEDILPLLPADFPWPVLVAQHMPASFTGPFSRRMNGLCALQVREVGRLEPILPGTVYVARGATDLVVGERAGRLMAITRPESMAHRWHPSVDVMVESALQHLPPDRLIGVQLTGIGDDGANAMTELKRRGGKTIAESEETAVVYGMPKELVTRGGASVVLPAHKIAKQLKLWLN
jgi:two-component system chemotaxis response regulator CheB